ncbi:pyruvate dehydrogenase (acetyl-transferring) E1 component subunit alpha [Streptomyces platensis]|uniref:Pyruvate dehydrogenase E1 component subunit alpha n=1 Tax=Streptomyces platensis TaxID=58346 RepID=A0AAE6NEN4_STRPT|nr:pyruvate dehydrogenase (acetyl-transferring) E1 component subunit alpha [Streptomyces platensis]OSY41672.1 Acetoin:2,6-dichlorophenolindophenol oxidoreductase subunit alpha [Streptomyces platensis]QEV50495.1 pyruvate dehydrogenase (acetyl-transferring) E1 component subunit alpha [Streptomyces platensis]
MSSSPTPGRDPAADTAGTARPAPASTVSDSEADVLRGYYRQMALIRAFELRAAEMYTRAKIGGYCHLNLGEEATCVGLMAALRSTDYLFTTYREHGYALARGADPGRVMAELFGRTTGMSGGRGGSMHLFDTELRLLGGYGIVGGQLPLATGAALAISYRGEPGSGSEAVMCLLGDGTTNIGAFHEALNLAAVWHLPIVYVIVNNQLGMGTPVAAAAGEPELFRRGCAYRIPGTRVDGGDVLAVRDAARMALEQARAEHHPRLLETVSYRLRGHSVVDPARYRTPEEAAQLREKDPVPALRIRLIEEGILTPQSADRIDEEADQQVSLAVDFADAGPAPGVETLFDHLYATEVANVFPGLPGDPLPCEQAINRAQDGA